MINKGWVIGQVKETPKNFTTIHNMFAAFYRTSQERQRDASGNLLSKGNGDPLYEEVIKYEIGPFIPGEGPMTATFQVFGWYEATAQERAAYNDLLKEFKKKR